MYVKYNIVLNDLKIEATLQQTKDCSDLYNVWDHSFRTYAKFSEKITRACKFTESTLLLRCFSRFLDCTNGTKSREASQINIKITYMHLKDNLDVSKENNQ